MSTSTMLGRLAASPSKDEVDDQIENFLNCKEKEVRIKLRIATEGSAYEVEVDADTEFVQKFVSKLMKSHPELTRKRSSAAGRNTPAKPPTGSRTAVPRSASPMTAGSAANLIPVNFFATPLNLIMEKQRAQYPELTIPRFIDQCIKFIIAKGLGVEGLFRLSGTNTSILAIKEKLNSIHPDYEIDKNEDVHNITGLLKSFLRELPEPLLPSEFYHELLSLTGSQFPVEVQLKLLGKMIAIVPKTNQHLLSELCWLLGIVAQSSDLNKMHRDNLGKVIGPNILWTKATQSDLNKLQIESDKVNLVASLLINHHSTIFKDLAPPAAWLENPSLQTKFASGNKKSIQCFAQAGETVWSADSSGVIRIIDINTNLINKEIAVGKGAVFAMHCINSHMWVASERALQVYDVETLGMLKEHPFASFDLSYSPATNSMYVAAWEGVHIFDEAVRLVDLEMAKDVPPQSMEQMASFDTSNDAKVLLVRGTRLWIGTPKALQVYDTETHQQLKEHKVHQRQVSSIRDLGDGRLLTTSADMKIATWDAETLEMIKIIDGHSAKVMSAVVLPGTPYLFTSAWDCTVRMWNSKTLELVREIKGQHQDCISHMDLVYRKSDNTWYIWTASWDKFLCVWKPKEQPVFPTADEYEAPAPVPTPAAVLPPPIAAPAPTPTPFIVKRPAGNALSHLPPPPAPLHVGGPSAPPSLHSPTTGASRAVPFKKP